MKTTALLLGSIALVRGGHQLYQEKTQFGLEAKFRFTHFFSVA